MYFRVPKKTFDEADLQQRLNLTPVDELDELQVYGRGERVKTNESKGAFQEVVLDIHWEREVQTPEFHGFVQEAATAYLGKVESLGVSAEEIMPWKVLGRKWHVSRKGFPSNKQVKWTVTTLEQLCELLETTCVQDTIDWTNKQVVYWMAAGAKSPRMELYTKRREGIDLVLLTEPGQVALGRIANLGDEREITQHRSGLDAVRFRFVTQKSVKAKGLQEFLTEHLGTTT